MDFAADECHIGCDSCVVVALTHGGRGTLLGSGERVYNAAGDDTNAVHIHDFVECFGADKMTALKGRPKIFVFQACRGG